MKNRNEKVSRKWNATVDDKLYAYTHTYISKEEASLQSHDGTGTKTLCLFFGWLGFGIREENQGGVELIKSEAAKAY